MGAAAGSPVGVVGTGDGATVRGTVLTTAAMRPAYLTVRPRLKS